MKNALGSKPSFDNVAKEPLAMDLNLEGLETGLDDILPVEGPAIDLTNEQAKANRDSLKKMLETEHEEQVKELNRPNRSKEEPKKSAKKRTEKKELPANKKNLAEGYTRQTFAVRDDHLEIIKALAFYEGLEQKTMLEALLDAGLEQIGEDTKEKALTSFKRRERNKAIDRVRTIFK